VSAGRAGSARSTAAGRRSRRASAATPATARRTGRAAAARRAASVAALGAAALLVAGCARKPDPRVAAEAEARIAELHAAHEALHDSLEALVAGDSLLLAAAADTGQVIVALREPLVENLVNEVTRRYLDRVEVHLTPDVEVEESGEIRVKVLVARVKAGDWHVHLTIHRIDGVLRAKPPAVTVTGTNRLELALPVTLEDGRGEATLRFRWDAAGVAGAVCGDFETTQRITGRVLPAGYTIDGAFVLSANERTIVAEPEFPAEKFRLVVDLSPESWDEVRRTLASQDKIFKCGIALDPPDVIQKLRALGRKGFNVKLPRSIFRTVELPASVSEAVTVETRRVELSVRPNVLRVTPRTFWYSAAVETAISDAAPAPADTLVQPGESPAGAAGGAVGGAGD
jgi:hypothetical protein